MTKSFKKKVLSGENHFKETKNDFKKKIVDMCKKNFKNVTFNEADFEFAYRIGMRRENTLISRPVLVCFQDKQKRRMFWGKRFYLGKGENVYVDADAFVDVDV